MPSIHKTEYGTYHPADNDCPAWTVNDTRGYIDGGPACDECGACECEPCERHGAPPSGLVHDCDCGNHFGGCVGLSFAYICLDGGESLCEECFDKDGQIEVIPCDCK